LGFTGLHTFTFEVLKFLCMLLTFNDWPYLGLKICSVKFNIQVWCIPRSCSFNAVVPNFCYSGQTIRLESFRKWAGRTARRMKWIYSLIWAVAKYFPEVKASERRSDEGRLLYYLSIYKFQGLQYVENIWMRLQRSWIKYTVRSFVYWYP
jgi:hypothetical protein